MTPYDANELAQRVALLEKRVEELEREALEIKAAQRRDSQDRLRMSRGG